MASKTKSAEKSIQERFKSWIKGGKVPASGSTAYTGASAAFPALSGSGGSRLPDFELSADLLHGLSPESALDSRLKVVRDLTEIVRHQRLQEYGVELVWAKTKDLCELPDAAARNAALLLYTALVTGQYDSLDAMRATFFRLIEQRCRQDPKPCLNLLDALTRQGKEIVHFEEKVGSLLLSVFPIVIGNDFLAQFLQILLNTIKFNPAYLDPEVVCQLIGFLSNICLSNASNEIILVCLQCLYAILGYSYVPREALHVFIATLCCVVNMATACTEAWRIMSSLMATHLGHSALYDLCQVVQDDQSHADVALVRGAVFFIGMSLWGSKCVRTLQSYSPMTILPTFVQALKCKHHLVTYEITLQLERLVLKRGDSLRAPECDCALDLIEALITTIPEHADDKIRTEIYAHLHNTITKLEALSEDKKFNGSQTKLFDVIDRCSAQRPEGSVIRLIAYRASSIYPTKTAWIRCLNSLMERYYVSECESRSGVRIRCLQVLAEVVRANRHMYEEELVDRIVLPFLKAADTEPCKIVRTEAIKVLTNLIGECTSKPSYNLLDILERVLSKPHDTNALSMAEVEQQMTDAHLVAIGLIQTFRARLVQPQAEFVARIYKILVGHVFDHYTHEAVYAVRGGTVRLEIFKLFMALRASESFHLGVAADDNDSVGIDSGNEEVRFSPSIVCREVQTAMPSTASNAAAKDTSSESVVGYTYLSLTRACFAVIKSLSEERDWRVLKLILKKVPSVLQNKALLTRYGADIHHFIQPLVDLTSKGSKYPDVLVNSPAGFTRSEFHNHIYPVLSAMASYNEILDPNMQRELIKALHLGLNSVDCNRVCIVALTTCALEMKKCMSHYITHLLLSFSKISATKMIAMPMLEFLSTLIRLPEIFSNFTDNNYMSVFAIALPYTNPHKFDAYTVSLAHHVIIMWFLKCRLTYRQNFGKFIIASLNSNVLQSLGDDGKLRRGSNTATVGTASAVARAAAEAAAASKQMLLHGVDSVADSLRPRSSSMSNDSATKVFMRERHMTMAMSSSTASKDEDARAQKMASFHKELNETCVDILARYMFANVAVQPKRMPTAEFLLKGGNSATWLVNAMLVTVTTSHCDQNSSRSGLCERCYLLCSRTASRVPSTSALTLLNTADGSATLDDEGRRRHQSEFQRPSPSRALPGEMDLLRSQKPGDKLVEGLKSDGAKTEGKPATAEEGRLEKMLREQKESTVKKPDLCACWCSGWAEVFIRRPSGDVSWMCRIQNSSLVSDSMAEFPLTDLTALFHPSKVNSLNQPAQTIHELKEYKGETISVFDQPQDSTEEIPVVSSQQNQTEAAKSPVHRTASAPKDSGVAGVAPANDKQADKTGSETASSSGARQGYDAILEDDGASEQANGEASELTHHFQHSHLAQRRRVSLQDGGAATDDFQLRVKLNAKLEEAAKAKGSVSSAAPAAASPVTAPVDDRPGMGLSGRDRAHTVSGANPRRMLLMRDGMTLRRQGADFLRSTSASSAGSMSAAGGAQAGNERVTGVSPQFVFLQFFQSMLASLPKNEWPILLGATKAVEASIRNLDRIHAHETYKIGVLYIGPGQADDEAAILLNTFGSLRYAQFLHGLGSLISLKEIDRATTYVGGLDHEDGDGDFAYMWEDDVMQVIFHVATLMPNTEKDPKANKKKRHIGNDFVAIVYNNSGSRYKLGTVKGQFIAACVVVVPLDQGSNKVFIECRPELEEPLGHVKDAKIVSDRNLAVLVRQLALHCNLAAQIHKSLGAGHEPYSSNWLERLRQIKRIRDKAMAEAAATEQQTGGGAAAGVHASKLPPNDFTSIALRKATAREDQPQ